MEIKSEVRSFMVHQYCDVPDCLGEMKSTGSTNLMNPPKYLHVCSVCYGTESFYSCYPRIEHEELFAAESPNTKRFKPTAEQVASLRSLTDYPMMECKKALYESEGDVIKAMEYLRDPRRLDTKLVTRRML